VAESESLSLGHPWLDEVVRIGADRHHRLPMAASLAQYLRRTKPGISEAEVARHLAPYAAHSHPPLSAEELLRAIRAGHWSEVAEPGHEPDEHLGPGPMEAPEPEELEAPSPAPRGA
jgi:hypothetical protein